MSQTNRSFTFLPALILSLGIAAAGYFVGQTMYNSSVGINTAEVKGLAERRVEADRAFWRIQYTVTGRDEAAMQALYEKSKADRSKIVGILLESGFGEAEITPGVVDYNHQEFRDDDQVLVEERFYLTGSIEVETDKVRLVSEARSKLNELIAQGVDIRNNAPSYYFTGLNEIKPEMLKEATTNARLAANEFASNAGVDVGGIRSARQGGFIIKDVGENYSDTMKIEKDVRVVTTISFYLTK
ncbi:MAG: SIMPL domain-containing protein [Gammaproteobacteria bacterium]|nr:SIMPL domain-containing protein [Gammaproteobacteria bacterium]MDH5619089.1 SIMPL domain-containing protein [Gammaproteobacteria bacterium]